MIPVYNEADNLAELQRRLLPVMTEAADDSWEVIYVDDGSTDESPTMLQALHQKDPRVRVVQFSRNFGHQAALQAGLDVSTGRAVVLLDADLQDPPELIKDLVTRWREGIEVVYAVRRSRRENVLKRSAYHLFYLTLRAVAEIDLPLDAGDFCLLDRRVVDTLVRLRERNRFLRGLRSWVGFSHVGVPFDRAARFRGSPKYTLRRLIQLAISGYVGFSARPLRAATWLGFASSLTGFGFGIWAIIDKLQGNHPPAGWASLMGTVMFVGGVQLLMLGVIGTYLGRVYDEVRARPLYVVKRLEGLQWDRIQEAGPRRFSESGPDPN